jgi:hypothetical protein
VHEDFTLSDAKTAVLQTLTRMITEEHVLSDAQAADYASRVDEFTDAFELDEWVLGTRPLDDRTCRWPLCFRSPRPPAVTEDGMNKGGNRPRYCDNHDEGNPDTVPQRSRRRRMTLRDRRARASARSDETGTTGGDEDTQSLFRTRATMASMVVTIERRITELTDELRTLQQLARDATDEQMVTAEIEAVRVAASQDVQREAGLRVAAEQNAMQEGIKARRMAAEVEEIQAALLALEKSSAQDRAERDDADERAESAERAAEVAREEANRRITEADKARKATILDAQARDRETEKRIAAMEQLVASLRQERDEAKAACTRLAEANTVLHDDALRRERAFEADLNALRTAEKVTQDGLREAITELRDRVEQLLVKHEDDLSKERARHEVVLAARLGEAADTASAVHQASIVALTTENKLLQARLDTAATSVQGEVRS